MDTGSRKDKSKDFNEVYPTSKTLDEITAAKKRRELARKSKRPKHILIVTSLQLYSVLIGIGLVIFFVPSLIKFNIISGVFFSFLAVAAMAGYAVWTVNAISSSFYAFGRSARPFLVAYAVVFILVMCALNWFIGSNLALFFLVGTLFHFAIAYMLLKRIFNRGIVE